MPAASLSPLLIDAEKACLGEMLYFVKRVRVLPARRARRQDALRLQRDVQRYFAVLAARLPAERLARQASQRVAKGPEDDAADFLVREWMEFDAAGRRAVHRLDLILTSRLAATLAHAVWVLGRDVLKVPVSWTLSRPEAISYLEQQAGQRIRGINDYTRRELARELAQGVREGQGIPQLAERLRRTVRGMGEARAQTIAWTETGFAYGYAQEKLAGQLGARQKRWLTARDERVCDQCEANAAQGAIPVGQLFAGGVMWEVQHPHCRCTTLLEDLP